MVTTHDTTIDIVLRLLHQGNRTCEAFYRMAVQLRPQYTAAWTNLGLVLLNTGAPFHIALATLYALALSWDAARLPRYYKRRERHVCLKCCNAEMTYQMMQFRWNVGGQVMQELTSNTYTDSRKDMTTPMCGVTD